MSESLDTSETLLTTCLPIQNHNEDVAPVDVPPLARPPSECEAQAVETNRDKLTNESSNSSPESIKTNKKDKRHGKYGKTKYKGKPIPVKDAKSDCDIGKPPVNPLHDATDDNKLNNGINNGKKRPDKQLYVPPPAKNNGSGELRSSPSPSGSAHGMMSNDTSPSSHSPAQASCTEGSRPESTNSNKASTAKVLKDQNSSTEGNEIADSWENFDEDDTELEERIRAALDLKSVPNEQLEVDRVNNSFEQFRSQDFHLEPDEYSHILEAYDFVSDLKTQDLFQTLKYHNSKDFDIKWVDETHALVIFSGSVAAQHALGGSYSNLKLRPLHLGTRESKMKAKRSSEQMLPYKQRPETSAALARRLVSGALGIRVQITPEQREAEKKKLQKAKEERRQARQKEAAQTEDLWEAK